MAEATYRIPLFEQDLVLLLEVEATTRTVQNLNSQHKVGSTYEIATYEPLASESVTYVIMKTQDEFKKENEEVRTKLDRRDETNY